MANYSNLIAAIQATIYNNGQNLITGSALQGVLIDMVQELGQAGAVFGGVVDRDFVPATTDSNIFYVASVPGTYSGFGQSVSVGEFAIFYYDGTDWQKATVTSAEVEVTTTNQTGVNLATISVGGQSYQIRAEKKDTTPTIGSSYAVTSNGVAAAIASAVNSINNALALKADTTYVDNGLAGKADKVAGAVNGNMAALDASGNLTDSGIASSAVGDVANKIDRVAGAGVGNVAMFDAIGGIEDSEVPADNIAQQDGYYSPMIVGAAENLVGQDVVSAQFTRRVSGGSADVGTGAALIKSIKGNTLVWNQLIENGDFANGTTGFNFPSNVTGSVNADGSIRITNNLANNANFDFRKTLSIPTGHKIATIVVAKSSSNTVVSTLVNNAGSNSTSLTAGVKTVIRALETPTSSSSVQRPIFVTGDKSVGAYIDVYSVNYIDLTQMFGSGNEPSTAAEFEALFPLNYYANVTPFLLNNKAASLVTTGFNQWDEEWESGKYNTTTGEPEAAATQIRSKNYIPVFGNTDYYFQFPLGVGNLVIMRYDIDKNYLGYNAIQPSIRTLSTDTRFIRFYMTVSYGTTYKNDICINLSDVNKNGTYEPYEKHTLALNLTGLTSGGTAIFADGMKSAGSVYDEVDGAKAIKRIGSRAYQAGDESDTSVKTDGTTTYYALTTPEEYTLDAPLSMQYEINNDGTEEITPENGSTPTTAPFSAEIQYAMNAVDTLRNLPKNYISKASMDSILTAFKTAGVITAYTLTWDATNQKYNCTITV